MSTAGSATASSPRTFSGGSVSSGCSGPSIRRSTAARDVGFLNMVIAAEEVGKGCPDLVTAFNMNAMTGTMAILNFGTDEQRQAFLPDLLAGRSIGSIAITEAGGGSDVLGNMRTRARRDGDEWLLDGTKLWITMSPVADVCVLFAKTDLGAHTAA